jgi:hypothetical protein
MHRSSNPNFVVEEGDHVFFELTTQSGKDLGKVPQEYIERKVKFHKQLRAGDAYNLQLDDPSRHLLVLCFNGADNVQVKKVFDRCCQKNGVRGVSVYIASDVVDQWKLELQLTETRQEAKVAQKAVKAAEKTAKAAQKAAKAAEETAKAAEETAKELAGENAALRRELAKTRMEKKRGRLEETVEGATKKKKRLC